MNKTFIIILYIIIFLVSTSLVIHYKRVNPEKILVLSTVFSIVIVVSTTILIYSLTTSNGPPGPPTPGPPTPGPPTPGPPTPGPSASKLNVNYLTIEYTPEKYHVVDTISPWFNESIKLMKNGDVAFLMTDYMIIHDDIITNMNTAMDNGAKFILGADRWYICGVPYNCNDQKSQTCPECNVDPDKRPPNCNCNIPQAEGCNSFNSILNKLNYCTKNKTNIFLIDQPSNKDNSKIWGHAHRKIVNFYYNSTKKAHMICGSWNIDADLNRRSLGVKETSLGVATNLSDPFAQYMLQMDIDTLAPLLLFEPSIALVSPKVIDFLKTFKTQKGYPELPFKSDVSWFDGGSSGTDKNVEIWMGISPPPQNSPNKFIAPKGVVYENTPVPNGDDNWQDQYNIMLGKSKLCQGSNSTTGVWYGKNKLDFASGSTWSGLLFQKFFDSSKTSPFINISMYIGLADGHQPCKYLNGSYGWTGCTPENNYRSSQAGGWYAHTFPLLFPMIRDYANVDGKSIRILAGQYNSSNDSSWRPWTLDAFTQINKPSNIHLKWFNQPGSDQTNVFNCKDHCAGDKCCRNHEKLYISDKNLLISSGHPERGYYSDLNGINNDILFLNAPGLAKVYNNHFKLGWQKQSVTINSKTGSQTWWDKDWDILTTPVKWQ
jgi:hypothetical protein